MSAAAEADAVARARDYYNSADADNFYFHVWGGEDIHVGIYLAPDGDIAEASRRSVEFMAGRAARLDAGTRVLDLGAGYGGAARTLAREYGCRVVALNLSEVENERNRAANRAAGLADRIEVVDGDFESLPFDDGSFDLVWSQDAILHSGDRERVVREAARVLAPGGELLFTDPMQADDCPPGVLQPVLDRIHLASLGSVGFYRDAASRAGLEFVEFIPLTEHLVTHYRRVGEELGRRREELAAEVSRDYLERMLAGLGHWVDAGEAGRLAWGVLRFRRRD